jgi:hypothetical protein
VHGPRQVSVGDNIGAHRLRVAPDIFQISHSAAGTLWSDCGAVVKHDSAKDSRHVAPAWLLDLEKLDLPALR